MNTTTKPKYWMGEVGKTDDFGAPINGVFIDGKTTMGPWAIFSEESWRAYGYKQLGPGMGQKYQLQEDGKWLKIDG